MVSDFAVGLNPDPYSCYDVICKGLFGGNGRRVNSSVS